MNGLGCSELVSSEQPRGWRVAPGTGWLSVRGDGYFRLIPSVAPGYRGEPR